MQEIEESGHNLTDNMQSMLPTKKLSETTLKNLRTIAWDPPAENVSATDQVKLLFQAADAAEESEAMMRDVWGEVEFDGGEEANAELVLQLEKQFARQLVQTTVARLQDRMALKRREEQSQRQASEGENVTLDLTSGDESTSEGDNVGTAPHGVFQLALQRSSEISDLVSTPRI